MTLTHAWRGIECLDLEALWASLEDVPHDRRLSALLSNCGVPFHDSGQLYAARPRILLAALGGRTISLGSGSGLPVADIPKALADVEALMGFAGMMSYLNPKDRTGAEMLALNSRMHGIPSTAHTAHLGVFIAGLSTAAELELACQRDIIHLSRLTNARTRAMDNPPFLVRSASGLPRLEALRLLINESWPVREGMTASDREQRNTLWPTCKCSAVLITGSVKNLIKLAEHRNDPGKEDDLREILVEMHALLGGLFPDLIAPQDPLSEK